MFTEQEWRKPLKFDWAGENGPPFTKEDLEQSVINLIINDDFHPPWDPPVYIRKEPWFDSLYTRACKNELRKGLQNGSDDEYIPGIQKIPRYPKLSTLTKAQHMAGLKVLTPIYRCQPWHFATPTQDDYGTFEKIKDIYRVEQTEYRLWAKKCWMNGDCIRTLNPNPIVEAVYDTQFQLRKMEFSSMPNQFTMVADMALEPREEAFKIKHVKNLKNVNLYTVPSVDIPVKISEDVSILKPDAVETPCPRHDIKFMLPHEDKLTTQRQSEINRQLGLFAFENGANFIASEKALQSLFEMQLTWKLPVSVEAVKCPESGDVKTVVVLGTGFHLQKECGKQRYFEAFRRLLLNAFTSSEVSTPSIPCSPAHQEDTNLERGGVPHWYLPDEKVTFRTPPNDSESKEPTDASSNGILPDASSTPSAHQEDTNLEHVSNSSVHSNDCINNAPNYANSMASSENNPFDDQETDYSAPAYGVASYEEGGPPPRSYKKWQVKNTTTNKSFDLIIHSAHKCRNYDSGSEVILEPIVEWQPELGACKQSPGRVRALALALMMRPDAELVNVRVDYKTGKVIVIDTLSEEMWKQWHGDKAEEIAGRIHAAIEQLRLLTPGQYILAHDPCHDAHAMIYKESMAAAAGFAGYSISLPPDSEDLSGSEEAALAKTHYTELSRALLPYHKAREILPLAFPYNKKHVQGYTKKRSPAATPANLQEKKRLNKKKRMKEKRKRAAKKAAKEKLSNGTS